MNPWIFSIWRPGHPINLHGTIPLNFYHLQTQQQIDHNDSIKLDLACIKKGKTPPLYTTHEYIVVNEFENTNVHAANDIDELLVKSTILHGKLTEVVKLAEDEKSDEGKEISKLEKQEIMEAIKNLENKILKIKLTIDKK